MNGTGRKGEEESMWVICGKSEGKRPLGGLRKHVSHGRRYDAQRIARNVFSV
jgi:hypothetical protein